VISPRTRLSQAGSGRQVKDLPASSPRDGPLPHLLPGSQAAAGRRRGFGRILASFVAGAMRRANGKDLARLKSILEAS